MSKLAAAQGSMMQALGGIGQARIGAKSAREGMASQERLQKSQLGFQAGEAASGRKHDISMKQQGASLAGQAQQRKFGQQRELQQAEFGEAEAQRDWEATQKTNDQQFMRTRDKWMATKKEDLLYLEDEITTLQAEDDFERAKEAAGILHKRTGEIAALSSAKQLQLLMVGAAISGATQQGQQRFMLALTKTKLGEESKVKLFERMIKQQSESLQGRYSPESLASPESVMFPGGTPVDPRKDILGALGLSNVNDLAGRPPVEIMAAKAALEAAVARMAADEGAAMAAIQDSSVVKTANDEGAKVFMVAARRMYRRRQSEMRSILKDVKTISQGLSDPRIALDSLSAVESVIQEGAGDLTMSLSMVSGLIRKQYKLAGYSDADIDKALGVDAIPPGPGAEPGYK